MLGALIGGGLGLLGGMMANESREDESASNRAFQERMSNTSYQRAMEDMRKAGLNPMLAYSQGGASVPAGSMAQFENPMASAAQAFSAIQSSGAAVTGAEASAQQAVTSASIGEATISKIKQEVTNLQTDNDRLKAVVTNLGEEYQNLIKTGYNITEAGNLMRAQIDKLFAEVPNIKTDTFLKEAQTALADANRALSGAETQLKGFDIKAAEDFGNSARVAGQIAPILDIIVKFLRFSQRGR